MDEGRLEEIEATAEDAWFISEVRPDIAALVAEVRRLGKIEVGIADLIEQKKLAYDAIEMTILKEIDNGYYYGSSGVIELRGKADTLKSEWEPLEVLLNG